MISSTRVLQAMEDAISDQPEGRDYVYKDHHDVCRYYEWSDESEEIQPSCIVGQVLHRLAPEFEIVEGRAIHAMTASLMAAGFTRRAIAALTIAQRLQDVGHSWGAAYDAAASITWDPEHAISDFGD